jgi:hypothetical protein
MTVAGRTAAAGAGVLLAIACASSGGRPPRPPPDPPLRIWLPGIVHWGPDAGREVRFAIENGTNRTVSLPAPDPEGARVAVFGEAGETPVCSVDPGPGEGVPGSSLALSPGEQVIVAVDLAAECGALPPGEYRFEVAYRIPPVDGKGALTLPTRYGKLLVEGRGRAAARRGPPGPSRR